MTAANIHTNRRGRLSRLDADGEVGKKREEGAVYKI